jgi:hypothetical protein
VNGGNIAVGSTIPTEVTPAPGDPDEEAEMDDPTTRNRVIAQASARSAASSVHPGTQIWDSTLEQPIWSTGSSWVDATGTGV